MAEIVEFNFIFPIFQAGHSCIEHVLLFENHQISLGTAYAGVGDDVSEPFFSFFSEAEYKVDVSKSCLHADVKRITDSNPLPKFPAPLWALTDDLDHVCNSDSVFTSSSVVNEINRQIPGAVRSCAVSKHEAGVTASFEKLWSLPVSIEMR